ncbi:hypothetical protein TVAG_339050 [Trichomonas vaginalis G3]|uniref:EamA domain-containing protein n=1 Tax=Trichomonas vaginalis (strain ATCC PRA-98 / G3) TaxID=412133 RepID=A2FMR8_TRIV3|nr:negative regulation of mitochondrial outer membrane permeabilization protein [Trichomonas vaginalis G3]EAX93782.1 hypothetical protein TVAG_339050 [Trichomonas vaginalis G3]KAI5527829.1 negative regulation of mitochondrial outer membrane permeabilization protein [Trichomonas vaginalis G3]|eukprot:XP_001306712.1 hypothetical protein [Trichomonas vaginalis G3]
MSQESGNADFGWRSRHLYLIGCVLGNIFTAYTRTMIYNQKVTSFKGCQEQIFEKPWYGTLLMAIGMAFGNIVYKLMLKFSKDPPPSFAKIHFSLYLHALFPAALDIIFTVLYNIAILLIGPVFATLLRFCDIIYATFLRRIWLKQKLLPYSYVSLAIIMIGVIMTSISIAYDGLKKFEYNLKFWAALTFQILAQFASSIKAIREEQLLHQNDIHPVWLCGVEGLYEFFILTFMAFPILRVMPQRFGPGLVENFCEDWKMVGSSKVLIAYCFIYPFIAFEYNTCVFGVQFTANAVFFIVTDIFVGSISWFIDLFIFYAMKNSLFGLTPDNIGTNWNPRSPLRLVGIIIILIGSLLYTRVVKLPWFRYEESAVKVFKVNEPSEEVVMMV